MCLDAAVMGTCPTFINQSLRKKRKQCEGRQQGGGVRGDAERAGEGGRREFLEGGRGLNKAHIDVLNTAAGVS